MCIRDRWNSISLRSAGSRCCGAWRRTQDQQCPYQASRVPRPQDQRALRDRRATESSTKTWNWPRWKRTVLGRSLDQKYSPPPSCPSHWSTIPTNTPESSCPTPATSPMGLIAWYRISVLPGTKTEVIQDHFVLHQHSPSSEKFPSGSTHHLKTCLEQRSLNPFLWSCGFIQYVSRRLSNCLLYTSRCV